MNQQNNAQQWQPAAPSTGQVPPQAAAQTPSQAAPQPYPSYGYVPQQTVYPAGGAYAAPAAQGAPVVVQQKKSRGWIVALVTVVLIFALMAMGLHSCTQMMLGSMGSLGTSSSSAGLLTEDGVAIITLSGTIQYDGTSCSPEGLKGLLDEAEANPNVKAVVLRIDSGGGTATAGEEMSVYLKQFSKPVVVSSASINASAAYEISSQSDYIFVAKTTAIGAIGTAMQVTDLSGLMDKLGINVENITSAESKDSSYGTRFLTEEERAYYQDMVDQINATFIENVAQGRGMSVDAVSALATGMTFTGMDAVENGLADEIGTLEDACDKAAALGGIVGDYDVVYLEQESSELYDLLSLMSSSSSLNDVSVLIKELENDGAFAK